MKMNKLIKTALLTAALIPATSFAGFETGNSLLAECTNEGKETTDYMKRQYCYGYIAGIHDVHKTLVSLKETEPNFCVPIGEDGVTVGQLRKIAVKYLNEYPERLHFNASSLVSSAFFDAFPPSFKDDFTRYCPDQGASS